MFSRDGVRVKTPRGLIMFHPPEKQRARRLTERQDGNNKHRTMYLIILTTHN